jgi:hypothetical protein
VVVADAALQLQVDLFLLVELPVQNCHCWIVFEAIAFLEIVLVAFSEVAATMAATLLALASLNRIADAEQLLNQLYLDAHHVMAVPCLAKLSTAMAPCTPMHQFTVVERSTAKELFQTKAESSRKLQRRLRQLHLLTPESLKLHLLLATKLLPSIQTLSLFAKAKSTVSR